MPNNRGMEINHAVVRAIGLAGGLGKLAAIAGVKPPTAHEWKTGERPVPPRRCYLIEQGLKMQVTRKDLRPDDYAEHWPELAPAPAINAPAATENVAESGV